MKPYQKTILGAAFLCVFVLFTVLVRVVDVRAIGPLSSEVGFAAVNDAVRNFFPGNAVCDTVSDLFAILAILCGVGFAILGLCQLIRRKRLPDVDRDLFALGTLYIVLGICYLFFEFVVVNQRPLLKGGELEASYPSSHTLLTICVFVSAATQCAERLKQNPRLRRIAVIGFSAMSAAALILRVVSGYHWFTDVVGSLLLSASLLFLYFGAADSLKNRAPKKKA